MRMRKRQFRIGELADRLKIERFIVRFWEKEFGIKTHRSQGRQRYYDEEDLNRFQAIKTLLYERGFTIAGARKELEMMGKLSLDTARKTKTDDIQQVQELRQKMVAQRKEFENQIVNLKNELRRLKEIL